MTCALRFGDAANEMIEQTERKALNTATAEALNQRLENRLDADIGAFEIGHVAL